MQQNERQAVWMMEYAKKMPSGPIKTPQNPMKSLQKPLGPLME